MTRLIDADAITYDTQLEYQHDGKWENTPVVYKTDIDAQPTVDAVPVIRCKDCYFYGTFQRKHYCTKYEHTVKQDGFCAWAERKDHETD